MIYIDQLLVCLLQSWNSRVRHGHDSLVVGFITTYAISSLSPLMLWVWIPFIRDVLNTTLCDKFCQWLATGPWFSPSIPVSSTNKTDHHNITEILLKVALNTISQTLTQIQFFLKYMKHLILTRSEKNKSVWKFLLLVLCVYIFACVKYSFHQQGPSWLWSYSSCDQGDVRNIIW